MFSVVHVEGVTDLREELLELGESRLGKRDAERDDVGGWCAPQVEPVVWDCDALAQFKSLGSSADDARHGGEQKEGTGVGGDAHGDTTIWCAAGLTVVVYDRQLGNGDLTHKTRKRLYWIVVDLLT